MRELSLSSGMVRLQIQPLTPLVDEFAGRLFGELDYIQEGPQRRALPGTQACSS